ncbi:MAG: hypothetical protein JWQ43_2753 [Glaciihabitans sp.]|nr:hypothetical protein [Glaciihabitans sp.]
MTRNQIVGFALLVGGLLIGIIGRLVHGGEESGEIYVAFWGFIALMTIISGGMILARTRHT